MPAASNGREGTLIIDDEVAPSERGLLVDTNGSYISLDAVTKEAAAAESDTGVYKPPALVTPDIYDSVVVAAFGGVTTQVGGKRMRIHPGALLIRAVPLFLAQITALICLRLDLELDAPVWTYHEKHEKHHAQEDVVVRMKLVMILILQVISFQELIGTLRVIIFVLNPASWTEVVRPDPDDPEWYYRFKFMFMPIFTAPIAIAACFWKFLIAYLVCLDSVSLIFVTSNITDAIQYSVAIFFITELDEYWWSVMQAVFHYDNFDGFRYETCSAEMRDRFEERALFRIPEAVKSRLLPTCVLNMLTGRRYGKTIGIFSTYALLCALYIRQLFVVLFAVHTNILPMARDVCTMYRFNHDEAHTFKVSAQLIRWAMNNLIVVNVAEDIDEVVQQKLDSDCEGRYLRMQGHDIVMLLNTYPLQCCAGIASIFFFLFMPQVAHLLYSTSSTKAFFYPHEPPSGETTPHAFSRMPATVETLQSEVQELRRE
eukprot:CAMPEP_0180696424 /NCGR_PEP_ID=MMETSP1038_2-20121128/2966_1 /TAXON_ID=632150 /ORGANISM="Azadinium spinosum, Strain 3D9" /LENGTH=484 /DNA_ID=CAMNT_0022727891 /DNA_START=65 /DNA_END=1516 /DNA_ORIENTATION=-